MDMTKIYQSCSTTKCTEEVRSVKQDKLRVRIEGARAAERMTQEELADRLGITAKTLSKRLMYPELLTVENLVRIGKALHISAEDIRGCINFQ